MLLLQIHPPRFAVSPLERHAPGPIHVKTEALRFALETMKIESAKMEIAKSCGSFQNVQATERPPLKVQRNLSSPSPIE